MNRSLTTPRWGRKLAAYMAGGAAVLVAQDAQAGIIYSGIQNVPVNDGDTYDLDVNGDAIPDFTFENVLNGGNGLYEFTVKGATGTSNLVAQALSGIDASVKSYGPGPTLLANSLDPLSTNEYVAFQFDIGGADHYGWARYSTTSATTGLSATIHDWAYNDIPGADIVVGNVPEPGSLALLALGAAGVGAFRARRRQDAASTDTL